VVVGASAASGEPLLSDDDKAVAAVVVGAVLLLLGVLTLRRRRRQEGPPKRSRMLAMIDDANTLEALGIGLVMSILNPNVAILFGGLAAVAAADVSDAGRIIAAAVLVGAALIGLVGPVLWYLVDRERLRRRQPLSRGGTAWRGTWSPPRPARWARCARW
jgi:LPXTG-motif cell wall-anchored protein